MSTIPIFNTIRIIPRDEEFLNRHRGARGEVFYDRDSDTLRLFDGTTYGGFALAKDDLSNVANSDFLAKASAAGVGGGGGSSFSLSFAADDSTVRTIESGNTVQFVGGDGISTTSDAEGNITITNTQLGFSIVSVAGSSDILADSIDTLTFVAGTNVTITADDATGEITIAAAGVGGASNSFTNIAVSGQNTIVASSTTDTLTFAAGTGITIATNSGTGTVTITNSSPAITPTFSGLTEASTANVTIDKIYLPAITMLAVDNSGTSAYTFDQYSGGNPSLYAINGTTIAFNLTGATGHPFLIQDGTGTNYDTGLVHVASDGTVSTGADAQGKDSGTLYWKIPADISGSYRYQCSLHPSMVGTIVVKNFVSI
jgi:plastocyanin